MFSIRKFRFLTFLIFRLLDLQNKLCCITMSEAGTYRATLFYSKWVQMGRYCCKDRHRGSARNRRHSDQIIHFGYFFDLP